RKTGGEPGGEAVTWAPPDCASARDGSSGRRATVAGSRSGATPVTPERTAASEVAGAAWQQGTFGGTGLCLQQQPAVTAGRPPQAVARAGAVVTAATTAKANSTGPKRRIEGECRSKS